MASIKKVKVHIEYQGKVKITEIAPYKTISIIKDVAKELFKPINSDIKLIYNYKDISEYENEIIGDYFKKSSIIKLKIQTQNNNNLKESNEKKKNQNNKTIKKKILCSCNRDYVSVFCRNCKEFICNLCRIDIKHLKHKVIQIDFDNLVESVKLYAIKLQSDIPIHIKKADDNFEKLETNKKDYDIFSRYDIINNQIDNVFNTYNNYIKNINCNNEEIENNINEYNTNYFNVSLEFDEIMENLNEKYIKTKKDMTEEEFKEYFKILSEKEENITNNSYNIIPYRVNNHLNENIVNMYNKIDNILDLTLNAKNPLGISSEVFRLYNLILQHQHDNDEEEKDELINLENDNNNNEENEMNDNNNEENEMNDNNNEDNYNNETNNNKLNDIKNKKNMEEQEKINLKDNGILNNENDDNQYMENEDEENKNPSSNE